MSAEKLLLISDVHANLHALEAVLSDISRRGLDAAPFLCFHASPDNDESSFKPSGEAVNILCGHVHAPLMRRPCPAEAWRSIPAA